MEATVIRTEPFRIEVHFRPTVVVDAYGNEVLYSDLYGKEAPHCYAAFRPSLTFDRRWMGRYEITSADDAGWCNWVHLVRAGLAETIDLGPATYGDTVILLTADLESAV